LFIFVSGYGLQKRREEKRIARPSCSVCSSHIG
jgi:hypothetical protein